MVANFPLPIALMASRVVSRRLAVGGGEAGPLSAAAPCANLLAWKARRIW